MTVAMLRDRGAVVDDTEPDVWRIEPSALKGGVIEVEPDLSNAAPFLAAALVAGGRFGFQLAEREARNRARRFVNFSHAWVPMCRCTTARSHGKRPRPHRRPG